MTDLAKTIAGLTPEQLELLQRRMARLDKKKGAEAEGRTEIVRQSRETGRFPLSFSQQRFWVLDQLQPGTPAYNIPLTMRLRGHLSPSLLKRSLNEVVRRQESLRATFHSGEGQPAQALSPFRPLTLPGIDLSSLPDEQRERELLRLASEEARWSFDLARGPMVRMTLVRLDRDEHAVFLTVHHIIADRWSLGIFLGELMACYESFEAGRPCPLPELKIQYVDYAVWQRQKLSDALGPQLDFWKEHLAGAPTLLDLPTDRPRPAVLQALRSPQGQRSLQLPKPLVDDLRRLAQEQDATLFMVLLAAFAALLGRYSGRDDLLVGSPITHRNRAGLQEIIGHFVNDAVLRCRLGGDPEFRELVTRAREASLAAYEHSDVPFERVVEELQPERAPGRPPLVQVFFVLETVPVPSGKSSGLSLAPIEIERPAGPFDLIFYLSESPAGVEGNLLFDADLFERETGVRLVDSFAEILRQGAAWPSIHLSELRLAEGLEATAAAARLRDRRPTIAMASTFTAEPVEEALSFWMEEIGSPSAITFAPYNQVFQQLLDPEGHFARNDFGVNVVLLRFEDWERYGRGGSTGQGDPTDDGERLRRDLDDLVRALRSAAGRWPVPCLVAVCPPSPAAERRHGALLAELEDTLAAALEETGGIYLVLSSEVARLYPVGEVFDRHADEMGHVPYTPLFFSALGTVLARRIHALRSAPLKVIAVDCDHTLWGGVCAEDGPFGVAIDPPHRELQRFLVRQQEEGVLICLCSKNSEEDVLAVFRERTDMPLRLSHVVARCIDWGRKSDNLRALAAELGLGLDSFAMLDDNPIERAEIRAHCPEVLVLELPDDWNDLPRFLDHVWAFDRLKVTAEDRRRNALYQQNLERERFLQRSLSFSDFLESLGLEVTIETPADSQLPRVAQLTQRTNQFNATTARRSEAELRKALQRGALEALSVRVWDRFGDYGLVGVLLFRTAGAALEVDTFLLSCRVLGKGVEHRMLARLGTFALERELEEVVVPYRESPRNQPARDFLEGLLEGLAEGDRKMDGEDLRFRFPAAAAARIAFVPRETDPAMSASSESGDAGAVRTSAAADRRQEALRLARIASKFSRPQAVLDAVTARRHRARSEGSKELVLPRTPTEEMLADLWNEVLGTNQVGVYDNFFRSGGHSLLGTLLISRIQRTFEIELPLLALFDKPTIAGLAEEVEQRLVFGLDVAELEDSFAEIEGLTDEEVAAFLAQEHNSVLRSLA
ncbi:MAG TPA: HAD-IIIC family phosphatase [Thermoanaerobaculia bacterium]|nr:HAD-IIIC family phosphatase [Thermoanaerobaculia bacterium]